MKKIFTCIVAVVLATSAFAQTYIKQVLVLNEGHYNYATGEIETPVSVGSYSPITAEYTQLATIENARFATDIKIDGDYYYVAADSFLIKYNLETNALVNETIIQGIRKIAIWNDEIIVSRGEYFQSFDAYVQVYNKNSFDLVYSITNADIPYAAEGIVIKDDIAYVAVNNGFDFGSEVGLLAEINLTDADYVQSIDLGPDGKNPDNLMIDGDNIYTLNNKDYTGSSVSAFKISDATISTTNLINVSAGCGTSAYHAGTIFYQEFGSTSLSAYNPTTTELLSETDFSKSFYGLAYDPISGDMYGSETDYITYGKIYIYNASGELINTFDAGVSPSGFAFDERLVNSITENSSSINMTLYPNPASDYIMLNLQSLSTNSAQVQLFDAIGRKVLQTEISAATSKISIKNLPSGNYHINVIDTNGVASSSFIKL